MKANDILKEKMQGRNLIELLMEMYPDVNSTSKLMYEANQKTVEAALSIRFSKDEKEQYLDEKIISKREYLEKSNLVALYNQLAGYSAENIDSIESKGEAFQGIGQMLGMIPSETHQAINPENLSLIKKMTGSNDAEKIDIKQADIILNDFGTVIPIFKTASETENPTETLMKYFVYLQYEIKFLEWLHEQKVKVNEQLILGAELEKIEWLGTQKQLAELFVELEKKGWVKEKKSKLISKYFTKAGTIFEILKQSGIDSEGLPDYPNIYTKTYSKCFRDIKSNTSNSNKQ